MSPCPFHSESTAIVAGTLSAVLDYRGYFAIAEHRAHPGLWSLPIVDALVFIGQPHTSG